MGMRFGHRLKCPDFNPVEQIFAKVKSCSGEWPAILRRHLRRPHDHPRKDQTQRVRKSSQPMPDTSNHNPGLNTSSAVIDLHRRP
jgi:hypothetical protein